MRIYLAASLILISPPLCAAQAPVLRKVVSLGCADCGGPAQFTEVADVAVTPAGTIYVADRDDPRIRVFSSSGRSIRTFGRRGEGPGEFTGIEKVFPGADGSIAVVDMRVFRLTRIDTVGRYLSSLSLRNFPLDASAAPGATAAHLLFSRFQPGTSFIQRSDPSQDTLVSEIGPIRDFPRLEAPAEIHSLAVAPDGSIAVGEGESEYRIRVYRNGRWNDLVRSVPRKLRTAAEMADMQTRMMGNRQRARAEGGQAAAEPPREKPHFSWLGLRYDPAGRLWVQTGRGDESRTVFDVFSAAGIYLGEVMAPGVVSAWSLGGEYLVTSQENQDGVPQVSLWKVH